MKVVGRDVPEVSRHRLLQELKGLFGPAFGLALEAYGRPFAELIARDEDFRVEVRDRFERGRAYGGFPVLSALLSCTTPEEQETFFKTGWIRLVPLLRHNAGNPGTASPGLAIARPTARTSTRALPSPSPTCAPSLASGSRNSCASDTTVWRSI
jgi:hypothetical protein